MCVCVCVCVCVKVGYKAFQFDKKDVEKATILEAILNIENVKRISSLRPLLIFTYLLIGKF